MAEPYSAKVYYFGVVPDLEIYMRNDDELHAAVLVQPMWTPKAELNIKKWRYIIIKLIIEN